MPIYVAKELIDEVIRKKRKNPEDKLEESLKTIKLEKENNVFRLYENEKDIGFAVRSMDLGGKNDLYIARMSVYPESVGYGTKLMEEIIKYAQEHAFDSVMFIADKPASVRIGEKLSFSVIGKIGVSPVMKKTISKSS